METQLTSQCLCCGNRLISQINQRRTYWFCRTCWQEMPMVRGVAVLDTNRALVKGGTKGGQTRLVLERAFQAQDASDLHPVP